MTIAARALNSLCPMHVIIRPDGQIRQAGPSLRKMLGRDPEGESFFDIFTLVRPRPIETLADLVTVEGRKLHLTIRDRSEIPLKGHLVSLDGDGVLLNLSFGFAVSQGARAFSLTNTDFAPTDLAMELLFLVEANGAAMGLSRHLNLRLQDARLAAEERAFSDTLTGLRNRRAMQSALDRIDRSGNPYALMHIDLDYFKTVNDTYGHAAGDHVLQIASRIMKDFTREDDLVARIGGDEFAIVFANSLNRERLERLAKSLIRAIEEPVPFQGTVLSISASIGIALCSAGRCPSDALLAAADSALYTAKRAGRAQHAFHVGVDWSESREGVQQRVSERR